MANDNNIFFVGAGFSRAISKEYPLLQDLNKILLGEKLEKLYSYNTLKYIPKSCYNNFESLLTYLALDLPWKDAKLKALHKIMYEDITNEIQKYFQHIYDSSTQDNTFSDLWKYIMQEGAPIISLNYDLLLEKNLNLYERYSNRISSFIKNINNYENYYRGKIVDIAHSVSDMFSLTDKYPEIIKLHGSINWYYAGDIHNTNIYCGDSETEIEKSLVENYKHFIVPPVLDKTIFYGHNLLEYLWKKAFKYIAQAKNIYIIGFSFPITDISVKYLFESAMNINCYKPKIHIVDINTSEDFKTKIENIFISKNLNFDYCGENALINFIQNELSSQIKEVE